MRRVLYLGLGGLIILLGVVIAPLPGPMGLPVAMVGTVIVLRNSGRARRTFVRYKRRYPKLFAPAMRILRPRRRAYAG